MARIYQEITLIATTVYFFHISVSILPDHPGNTSMEQYSRIALAVLYGVVSTGLYASKLLFERVMNDKNAQQNRDSRSGDASSARKIQ